VFKELYVYCISSVFCITAYGLRRKFVFKELFQLQMLKLSLSFFLLSHIFNRNLFIYFYLTLFPHNLSHFILEASTKKMGNVYKKSQILFL